MTAPKQVVKSDDAVNQAIGIIDSNRSFLQQQVATGQRIRDDVARNYVSGASLTFQQKVDDWVTVGQAVIQAFDDLEDDLKGASVTLDSGSENAQSHASSWAGDEVFGTLTGG